MKGKHYEWHMPQITKEFEEYEQLWRLIRDGLASITQEDKYSELEEKTNHILNESIDRSINQLPMKSILSDLDIILKGRSINVKQIIWLLMLVSGAMNDPLFPSTFEVIRDE